MIIRPSLFVPPWADAATAGDIQQPEISYIASGFPHSPDKPTRQTMNWALNYSSNGVQYLMSRGIPEWDGQQNYLIGDVVRATNNRYYSATANNVGRNPIQPANASVWQMWYIFPSDLGQLYVTPAQIAAMYLTTQNANQTFQTISNVDTIRQNLQNQIDGITAITGRGYLAGSGITIEPPQTQTASGTIINSAPNIQSNWLGADAAHGQILNRPTLHAVATSGDYSSLSNRFVAFGGGNNSGNVILAQVATTGNYNHLSNLPAVPPPQMQTAWNGSGIAAIAGQPPLYFDAPDNLWVFGGVNLQVDGWIRTPNQIQAWASDWHDNISLNCNSNPNVPQILSSTGVIDTTVINMQGAPWINYNRTGNPVAMEVRLAPASNSWMTILHDEITEIHIGAQTDHGFAAGYIWSRSGQFSFEASLSVFGDLTMQGDYFRVERGDGQQWLDINFTGGNPTFGSNTGTVVCPGWWQHENINCGNIQVYDSGGNNGSYFQIRNSNQFGPTDPWMWSSTGTIRVQCNLSCGDFWVNNVNCGGRVGAGLVESSGRINCNDLYISSNTIQNSIIVNGTVRSNGYAGRNANGGFDGHNHNFWWDGGNIQWVIDATNIGWIAHNPSDYRLKENVHTMTDCLAAVLRLRPVSYNFKTIPGTIFEGDGKLHDGFIAHEVGEVLPDGEVGTKDELTSDGEIQPQSLNLTAIVAALVGAIQEMHEQLLDLRSKLEPIG